MTSFEGPLVPHAFLPFTRMKYVPLPTPTATSDVAALPVSKLARFAAPLEEPASTTYELVGPAPAVHWSVTIDPLTVELNPVGAPGGLVQGFWPRRITTTSLDGVPTPTSLAA